MNKKIYLIFILYFISNVCSAGDWSVYEGKFQCPGIHNSFECAKKIERKLNLDFISRTDNDISLSVELRDNSVVQLKESGIRFLVLEYLNNKNMLVIFEQYWEGGAYGLLDLRSGSYVRFGGYPVFSPNEKHLVVAGLDLAAGYSANVLEIYTYNNNDFELMHKEITVTWGPSRVQWINDKKLAYDMATLECAFFDKDVCLRKILQFDNQKWESQTRSLTRPEISPK